MRSLVRTTLTALALLSTAAPGLAVTCGDVITDAQTLTADLNCGTEPAVTIGAGGSLDMDGFTIECMGTNEGVTLDGAGAKLSNGVVKGCASSAVRGNGGKHKIERVLASDSATGFSLVSTGNKISNCAALNNTVHGFYAPAPDNSLSRLVAKGNGTGVYVGTGNNKVTDVSISTTSLATGMQVIGDGNKVSKVRIAGAAIGLNVSGTDNKISQVTSLKHANSGFTISGSDNQVKKSVAATDSASGSGFYFFGTGNSISGCRSVGSAGGIAIVGANNVVSKNKVFGAAQNGIELSGSQNAASGNLATGNGTFDLYEGVAGCANEDVWKKNIGTRNDACIE